MRAVRFDRYGDVDELEVREVEDPVPAPDEVLGWTDERAAHAQLVAVPAYTALAARRTRGGKIVLHPSE